ncbi:MAG TPA: hypothetical protein VHO94_03980 [Oscillospiraceae bacterium]|nr:hypothetical protein [Oscillospiraceae bacterium]
MRTKKFIATFMAMIMLISLCFTPNVMAATTVSLAQEQAKFPDGTYWAGGNPDHYTTSPSKQENSFEGAYQCQGFALKLAYDLYGSNARDDWQRASNLNNLKPGDLIRYYTSSEHTIFVTNVNGNTITFADCNYVGKAGDCKIRWNGIMSKADISSRIDYVMVAPHALISGFDYRTYLFDAYFYSNMYPDLKNAFGYDENALWNHWITDGIKEGRVSSPLFDVKYYLANNSDLKNAFGSDYVAAYNHFLTNGYKEASRKTSPIMDIGWYYNHNPDVASAVGLNGIFVHLSQNGMKEGRATCSTFNPKNYAARYSDLRQAYGTSDYTNYYRHYIWHGISEGRDAS